ncbi:ATP-binding protein [Streptomyces sp. G-G2]|uniref:ATP-binding protein n=1 Tax=Streptomyces sp. G-G2 TaxID=3046201 RepID=UPI0024BA5761|nr:ATP-binding protein [Streptomyces sp. G-G2]MDJ0385524.1 ATP-binding protein [Streptomyces sp. G-G2]
MNQICDSSRQFAAQLAATPRGARRARQLVVERLTAWGLPTDGPALVVAELAANAVTHGRVSGRGFQVELELGGGVLRIEVVDTRGDRVPCLRDAEGGAEAGRGLVLVAAIADRWGVDPGPAPRKTVWAELDVPGRLGHGDVGSHDPVVRDVTP